MADVLPNSRYGTSKNFSDAGWIGDNVSVTEGEQALLRRELAAATHYFEYGSGESTLLALGQDNLRRIASVESDASFLERNLLPRAEVRENLASGRLTLHPIDVGPTRNWGMPRDNSRRENWPSYPRAIELAAEPWDLVLVDGRFRIACVAVVLLRCPKARILFHDFWNRPKYHVVREHCELLEREEKFGVFTAAPGLNEAAVRSMLGAHEYSPGL